MVNNNDWILVIGRSEIINDKLLSEISELFITIGINNTNISFHPTYTISVDAPSYVINHVGNFDKDTIFLASFYNINRIPPTIKAMVYDYKSIDLSCNTPYSGDTLHYCGFTHDVAVSFCIQQGYKNIVLVGAADFTNYHYDDNKPFIRSKRLEENSIRFLEDVCAKHCNLYTINPNSKLKVPRITIGELIEKVYDGK